MNAAKLRYLVPVLLAVVGGAVWARWAFSPAGSPSITKRIPGQDGGDEFSVPPVDIKGTYKSFEGVTATTLPGGWPQLRGPGRTGVSPETVSLLRQFDRKGPPQLWSVTLGEGYAGPAIHKGRVYMLDYDEHAQADMLRCWSLSEGKELWRRSYGIEVTRNHGMSRTTPAVSDKYVVTLGPRCHVMCCDAQTGEYKWGIDLQREYETAEPLWYAGQCPLIDGDRVIIAPSSKKGLMIAVDCETGKLVTLPDGSTWKTPNTMKWEMTHSSIVPMMYKGKKTYVYCGSGGVAGVAADDGRLLWETNVWKMQTNVPTPVIVDETRIFLSAGYGKGAMMIQLVESGDKITPSVLWTTDPQVFGAEQQTPILYKGNVYGVIPGGKLVCLSLEGKVLWDSGRDRFGLGAYMIADGMVILMNDTGTMTLVEAASAGYKRIALAEIWEEGVECWGPLALAGGRLLVRDSTRMVCLDMRKDQRD